MTDLAWVLSFYDDFNRRDLKSFVSKLSPDVVWKEPIGLEARPYVGPDQVRRLALEYTLALWPDAVMVVKETLQLSGHVIVQGELVGTHAATEVRHRLPFFHRWTIRARVVVAFEHSNDPAYRERVIRGETM